MELIKSLGTGACSEVWLARDRVTRALCALKIIKKRQVEALGLRAQVHTEKLVLRQGLGREVVALQAAFQDPHNLYLQLELAEHGSLAKVLRKRGSSLSLSERRTLVVQIAGLLHRIHSAGVVHGDLKPENLLVFGDKELKLADFGCARVVAGADPQLTEKYRKIQEKYGAARVVNAQEQNGEPADVLPDLFGTSYYMAPEIISGKEVGPGIDFWAFGVIIHYIYSGEYVFQGRSDSEVMEAVTMNRTQMDPNLPEPVRDLIQQLTRTALGERLGCRQASSEDNYRELFDHPFFSEETESVLDSDSRTSRLGELCRSSASLGHFVEVPVRARATTVRWLFVSEPVTLVVEGNALQVRREKDGTVLNEFALDRSLVVQFDDGFNLALERDGKRFTCVLRDEEPRVWMQRVRRALRQ